ncbi:lipopolysaccharide biosynthesis protein [Aliivibrio sifiae]|uniref:Lipopolysaccharide biosynthesis protein n=1 Tax=Aliivibrio sifiae TaxID=566293 RepID=A0A2S7X5D5_9GAMM|nr:lipopolysaccharide biosynthesis protein [Aliivibrio sifiae]PQJ85382.1 hypothetical protein BTO23_18860 [Aliivibrio sifiae]GLR76441.1 hypothetical protein GCM10007855_33160 [Aliivibrio sifiae]
MKDLTGKKVLFIGPSFFGYEDDIKNELIVQGAEVDYFDERPFTSSIGKILIRLGIKLLIKKAINEYYNNIIEQAKIVKYDYFFVISPETISNEIVEKIKATNPNMKSIIYMWDAIGNKNNANKLINSTSFDCCYSFDRNEVGLFPNLQFLPLFFSENFDVNYINEQLRKYSIIFIGTVHSDRYTLVNKIINQVDGNLLPFYSFFYCPSKLLFLFRKIQSKEFSNISLRDVSFSSLDKTSIRKLICESDIILDIEHPSQTGLTMRTIEALGLRKKLITTNEDIKYYDFYSSNNVCVIDRNKPVISKSFLNSMYIPPSEDIINKYSLREWIRTIFS